MEPYIPRELPIKDLDFSRLIKFVGDANAELARYDGLLQGIVNPQVLLSPLTMQEAVLSSKIEGTQATLDEVLEQEAGLIENKTVEKTQDIQEIVNYRKALMLAKDVFNERPITLMLVRQMHKVLLDSVRGKDKLPGEFRKDQNWIGPYGTPIENATFVPPSPLQLIDHLEKWQLYMEGSDVDVLIQLALVHAQFELIHPFNDGNGRIGRILIPLFLFRKKVLSSPMFYLSAYLEENREEYYSKLNSTSAKNDWSGWIEFFLKAVAIQSKRNADKAKEIMNLYEEMKDKIVKTIHSQYSIHMLDALFDRPIFQTSDFIRRTSIPKQTAMPLLKQLRGAGYLKILRESSGRKPAILAFPALLNIAEGKKVL